MNIKVKDIILFLLFCALAFENVFQTKISEYFSYLDEGITVLLLVWAVASALLRQSATLCPDDAKYLVATVVLCIVGLTGNYLYEIQPNHFAILIDVVTCLKFVVAFMCAKVILDDKNTLLSMIQGFSKFALFVLFGLMLANYIFDLGMSSGARLGFSFWFGHPSNFAATVVGLIVVLLPDLKRNRWAILFGLLVLVSTARIKAIGFALVLLVGILLYPRSKRIPVTFIIIGITCAVAVAYDQISLYFFNSSTARSILLHTSILVAKMFMPLGSGFATYGSNASGEYYTPFYYSLGFDKVYGLTPLNHDYLVDSFWPIIFGQFGLIGTIIFCISIIFLARIILRSIREGVPLWAAVAVPLYLVIASTSESAFFDSYAPYLAFVLAILLRQARAQVLDVASADESPSSMADGQANPGTKQAFLARSRRSGSR